MKRWFRAVLAVLLGIGLAVGVSYETVPAANTDAERFDAILVLGVPANWDGSPSPEERSRVLEGVRELRAGRAGHLILSGGAAHNPWVEGEAMARVAEQAGVPAADVIVEDRSRNTIENIFYSRKILEQHGWRSVEVVSSAWHLPRTALILEHSRGEAGLAWRTHAAPAPPGYGWPQVAASYAREAFETAALRWFGFGWLRWLRSYPGPARA